MLGLLMTMKGIKMAAVEPGNIIKVLFLKRTSWPWAAVCRWPVMCSGGSGTVEEVSAEEVPLRVSGCGRGTALQQFRWMSACDSEEGLTSVRNTPGRHRLRSLSVGHRESSHTGKAFSVHDPVGGRFRFDSACCVTPRPGLTEGARICAALARASTHLVVCTGLAVGLTVANR